MQNNKTAKKIGIMGGTFNPIHNGHITLAKSALMQFNLDKVLVMISPNPPHKAKDKILAIDKRVDMTKLSVEDIEGLEFSDFELDREGYVYTAETLTKLKEINKDTTYFFILGGDSLKNIEKWYKPEVVLKNAVILAAIRDDMDISAIEKQILYLHAKYDSDIRILKTKNMPYSSSSIREDIKNGVDVSDKLPKKVFEYIKENKLYRGDQL